MKISKETLVNLKACDAGLRKFVNAHGDKKLLFSECVKSESNSISDYFWFISHQELSDTHKKDLQLLAIEFAERVLPLFESEYPEDRRPRAAIEESKLYLSGGSSLDKLQEAQMGVKGIYFYAFTAVAYTSTSAAAAFASAAVHYATAAAIAHASHVITYASDASTSAAAAHASHVITYAEYSWQKQRLAEVASRWGW